MTSDALKAWADKTAETRARHLEAFTAAYLTYTDILPQDAVLVEAREGDITRWWFEKKGDGVGTALRG